MNISVLHPMRSRWGLLLLMFFLGLAFAANYHFASYDYHMDDAWIIGASYVDGGLLTPEGMAEAAESVEDQYRQQWETSHRFPGVLPIARLLQVNLVSENVGAHLILNLIAHALNSFLLFLVLVRVLRVGAVPAIMFSSLFALALNLDSGTYALSLWIGSSSVNLLTIFLALCLVASDRIALPRWAVIGIYAAYAAFAIGNYGAVVILPPLAIAHYMARKDVRAAAVYVMALSIPIAVNLIIISFAPDSAYVGTTIKMDAIHVLSNLSQNLLSLLGDSRWMNSIFIVLVLTGLAYGWKKRLVSLPELLLSSFLLLGMTGIYSLSARQAFPNPYFLYIPYAGFIMLLAVAAKSLVPDNTSFSIRTFLLFSAICVLGVYQYLGAAEYRQMRHDSAARIGSFRDDFRAVELATQSEEYGLVAIAGDNIYARTGALGYFDKTINTWRSKGNNRTYVLVSDVIPNSDPARAKIKTGYNQYVPTPRYEELSELAMEYGVAAGEIQLVEVSNHRVNPVSTTPPELGVVLDVTYDREMYGDGKSYNWTDGNAIFHVFNREQLAGKKAILSFTATSLFDDQLKVAHGDTSTSIDVATQTPRRVCEQIILGAGETRVTLEAKKSTVPPGDSRKLSFRVNGDYGVHLVDSVIRANGNLSGHEATGFYDLEQNYFRWTQPDARIAFSGCMGKRRITRLVLRGGFPAGNVPTVTLNGSYRPARTERIDKTTVAYYFPDFDGELATVDFGSARFEPDQPDPRRLGFMFASLDVD